jgi:hypothetical protein
MATRTTTYKATDPKAGMTVVELRAAIHEQKPAARVTVRVGFGGQIKQLTVEEEA